MGNVKSGLLSLRNKTTKLMARGNYGKLNSVPKNIRKSDRKMKRLQSLPLLALTDTVKTPK